MPARSSPAPRRRQAGLAAALLVWGGVTAGGAVFLARYDATAGAFARAADRWPEGSTIDLDPRRPTLVTIVHPRCACSRATIRELSRLMSRLGDRVAARIVVAVPGAAGDDWLRTDLVESARAVPGAAVLVDAGRIEAARFGALTSGQTFLYSPAGRLLFTGGITSARGHDGDNDGAQRIAAILTSAPGGPLDGAIAVTPVFGCEIHDPDDAVSARRAHRMTR